MFGTQCAWQTWSASSMFFWRKSKVTRLMYMHVVNSLSFEPPPAGWSFQWVSRNTDIACADAKVSPFILISGGSFDLGVFFWKEEENRIETTTKKKNENQTWQRHQVWHMLYQLDGRVKASLILWTFSRKNNEEKERNIRYGDAKYSMKARQKLTF